MYCGKMADSVEMPFGMVVWVGLRNQVLGGVQLPLTVMGILFRGIGRYNVTCRECVCVALAMQKG